jgi:ABC-type Na+ efflux pump permease subunit
VIVASVLLVLAPVVLFTAVLARETGGSPQFWNPIATAAAMAFLVGCVALVIAPIWVWVLNLTPREYRSRLRVAGHHE